MNNDKKESVIVVRCTKDQRFKLREAAARDQLSMRDYVLKRLDLESEQGVTMKDGESSGLKFGV